MSCKARKSKLSRWCRGRSKTILYVSAVRQNNCHQNIRGWAALFETTSNSGVHANGRRDGEMLSGGMNGMEKEIPVLPEKNSVVLPL